jgi:glycosyltransferase involved in cell wall biosynthesis
MGPRVSVVTTCFELGETLEEALASVEAQSFRDLELIVVDDGSRDPATLAALAAIPPSRATVLRTPNRGLPAARNHGVRAARGELLCCLDADDRLHPDWLARGVEAFERDPGLAFVSHWLRTFGDESWEWTPTDCGFPALLDVNTVNGAALVRRAVWEEVGGQDETLREGCEDWDFWIKLVERGHRGTIIPEILFYYRRRADSMSRALVGERHLDLYRALIERHPETFARHAPALWLRRQRDLGRLCDERDALDHEWDGWLAPRLDDRRSEARALRRIPEDPRVAELAAARERIGELERAHAQTLAALRDAHAAELAALRDAHAAELAALRDAHAAELAALRASWSWRLTRPLRAVVGALRGE